MPMQLEVAGSGGRRARATPTCRQREGSSDRRSASGKQLWVESS